MSGAPEDTELMAVRGGWMARSPNPRIAVIGETKQEALDKLAEALDAWARLVPPPNTQGRKRS